MTKTTGQHEGIDDDALWYKDAVIYELHVRAFFDDDGDGIGDFRGLIKKLDYLQDLGVTAIWLLPFYPSPLRDDGYDIADYARVHPAYGEMRQFRRFLREAHRRGLKVITELVINHTSSEHPWFQRARRAAAGSAERDFYVWTDVPDKYSEARIIFKDFETSNWTWDPVAGAYYWHRFYSHQPDLNFANPAVQEAVFKTLDFWMEMGVDGMRLDAVPYLYEEEGTNCENLPETHVFLKKLRKHIDDRYPHRMLLAEANQWPEDAAEYFGGGDECHMNFHFPLMPRLFMAVQLENSFPIHDILEQTPQIPDNCQWALFLRNHDELTLEMVTDEDRDYMYRVYANDPRARVNLGIRRRLVPLLGSRRKVELLNAILLSLPGTPVLYYGDEIGMGDNVYLGDRNGVRTPMQWSADRNAGFSRTNPQRLYLPPITDPEYHYEAINVEAQQSNPSSLLWWMKRLIALRKQSLVFGRGDVEFLKPDNTKVLAYVRCYEGECVLIVANLSRFVQYVELDLSKYQGLAPVEMFGQGEFPAIGTNPYPLSLGPHAFYWFTLSQQAGGVDHPEDVPLLHCSERWQSLITDRGRLKAALLAYLVQQSWFLGRGRKRKTVSIADVVPVGAGDAQLVLLEVAYVEGQPEMYAMPIAFVAEDHGADAQRHHRVIARVELRGAAGDPSRVGLIVDALDTRAFVDGLVELFGRTRRPNGRKGRLVASSFRRTDRFRRRKGEEPLVELGHNRTRVKVDRRMVLKLFRALEEGTSPDLEVSRYLVEKVGFDRVPVVVGAVEYHASGRSRAPVAVLQRYVRNQGTAWQTWTEAIARYYEEILSSEEIRDKSQLQQAPALGQAIKDVPELVSATVGTTLPLATLLGQRTAELHLALATETEEAAFRLEPFTQLHRRSLYQSSRSRLRRVLDQLRSRQRELPEQHARLAGWLLEHQSQVDQRLRKIVSTAIDSVRTRIHGDLNLDQVLYTGKDFVIFDFDGDRARPVNERRFKATPLRDVAATLRSFDYATEWELQHRVRPDDVPKLRRWADFWRGWISAIYFGSYLQHVDRARFVPSTADALAVLLDLCLIDKCVYEIGYELGVRPDWVGVPLRGLIRLLGVDPDTEA